MVEILTNILEKQLSTAGQIYIKKLSNKDIKEKEFDDLYFSYTDEDKNNLFKKSTKLTKKDIGLILVNFYKEEPLVRQKFNLDKE